MYGDDDLFLGFVDERHWRDHGVIMTSSNRASFHTAIILHYSRQHLLSARCHQLSVPRVRRSTLGSRAFSVARPTIWNSLPDHLRDPAVDSEQFRRDLKAYLFAVQS